MNSLVLNSLFLPLILVATLEPDFVQLLPSEKQKKYLGYKSSNKCHTFLEDRLLQAMCENQQLEDVPNNLRDIQVLYLADNHINELRSEAFSHYPSLAYLYLQHNNLQNIEEKVFDSTPKLEVLNLSGNSGLDELPKSILQLERLRNLYLNKNKLFNSHLEISNVRSPLQRVELSYNRLTKIPQLSPLNELVWLDVSLNYIKRIAVDDLAPMCSLKYLNITGNPIQFDETTCECHEFDKWISLKNITLYNLKKIECSKTMKKQCESLEISDHTLSLYDSCKSAISMKIQKEKLRKMWHRIGWCIGAFVVSITFIVLCWFYQCRKHKKTDSCENFSTSAWKMRKTDGLHLKT